jgi:AcrR family transcriptional regulator
MDQPKPARKPRFLRNRQAILDAATEIIAEQGIEALSMRTLAEKADYSPSTLYRYFKNKEEILDELARQALALSLEQTHNWEPDASAPLERILNSGMNLYSFAREHPVQYRLMTSPTASAPKSLEAFLADQNFRGLMDLLKGGAAAGQLRLPEGFDAEMTAVLLWFAVHGAAMLRTGMMEAYGEDCDALMEQLTAALKKLMEV